MKLIKLQHIIMSAFGQPALFHRVFMDCAVQGCLGWGSIPGTAGHRSVPCPGHCPAQSLPSQQRGKQPGQEQGHARAHSDTPGHTRTHSCTLVHICTHSGTLAHPLAHSGTLKQRAGCRIQETEIHELMPSSDSRLLLLK